MNRPQQSARAAPSPRQNLQQHLETIARASGVTLLYVIVVALPAGLAYVELGLAS